MKSLRLRSFLFVFIGLVAVGVTLFAPDVFALTPLDGSVLFGMSYLAKIADDPQLWHKWDMVAMRQGELKTEFREEEIGMSWGDDGPEKSDMVPASPIVKRTDLEEGGKYMDVKIDMPLFEDFFDILNAGRYGEQQRAGAEEELKRDNFRVLLDKWHLGIGEKEVEESIHNTAHLTPPQFMRKMVEMWTDNAAQRMDNGVWITAISGHDWHHFIEAADRGNLSDGDVPVADPQMGLMAPPSEHKRSFVWRPGGTGNVLAQIPYDADIDTYEANIVAELDQIDETATPGLKLFKQINRECLRSAMPAAQLRDMDGKVKNHYLVYVPGAIRDLAEEDERFEKVMNSAYQGIVDKHPLLRTGDIMYKNLIIRDSTKLETAEALTAAGQYNAISADTAQSSQILFNAGGTPEKYSITPGTRQFTAAGTAATAFGGQGLSRVGRIIVMGSASIVQATGKNFPLKKLDDTDYGLKDGIGKTKLFGCVRNENWTTGGVYSETPRSFQVFCLMDLQ